jgi:hypothetical protein
MMAALAGPTVRQQEVRPDQASALLVAPHLRSPPYRSLRPLRPGYIKRKWAVKIKHYNAVTLPDSSE